MPELLLEILCEEIPARMQKRGADDLKRLVCEKLDDMRLGNHSSDAQSFVTPRRLVLVVDDLPARQMNRVEVRKGPRVDSPQQAIDGFHRSLPKNTKVVERETEKGRFYFASIGEGGRATRSVLPEIIRSSIFSLPWPKSMMWGSWKGRWVRPIHHVLAIYDGKGIKLDPHNQGGIVSLLYPLQTMFRPDTTIGHRFLAPEHISVIDFKDYKTRLRKAFVILDANERRELIRRKAEAAAKRANLLFKPDPKLLEEVAGLVEWPVVQLGRIDEDYMDLPPEVLTSAMRNHQKYFVLEDSNGKLASRFVLVANTKGTKKGRAIVAGNERVLRARLADAKFFWDQDRKQTLESRVPNLAGRVFHAKLGSELDKVDRMQRLAATIAAHVPGADAPSAERAALLAKADLSTEMVGEFPELQGVMGHYYALADGEASDISNAIAEHYSPLGPNDSCPTAPLSAALALADKIDTLVGFWSIDELPTGSKDPFALRRSALGVIRLILENELNFEVRILIEWAWKNYPKGDDRNHLNTFDENLRAFLFDRLKVYLKGKDIRHDLIDALFARGGEDDLWRIYQKARSLQKFLDTEDGANLLIAYRRASNIVRIEEKKGNKIYSGVVDENLFLQDEERELWSSLSKVEQIIPSSSNLTQFDEALSELANLRSPVDRFFDEVTVNVEHNEELRANRLHLLSEITSCLNRVADFSQIEGGER